MNNTRDLQACCLSLLAVILASAGCTDGLWNTRGVRIWAVSELDTVFRDSSPELENEVFSQADGLIRLASGVNETVSFQLVFNSRETTANVHNIEMTALRLGDQAIPAEEIRFYRQAYVTVSDYPTWHLRLASSDRRPREFPDPLIPFSAAAGALPIELKPGRCEAVWVDVHIPAGTSPGTYQGRLRIVMGLGVSRQLDLIVNVWPFALPRSPQLPVLANVESASLLRHHIELAGKPYAPKRLRFDDAMYEQAVAVLDETMQLLHEHGCSPILHDVQPARQVSPEGQLDLDWSDYDRLVTGVLDGSIFEDRVAVVAWPMPVDNQNPSPDAYGGWGAPAYEKALTDYLRQCVTHFEQRGWLDRHFVLIPLTASTRRHRYGQFERLGQLVKDADPGIRLVCPLTPQSMEPYGWIDDPFRDVSQSVAIWCPPADRADAGALARQRTAGKQAWLRPGKPPYTGSLSLIAPPVHARSIAWQAYRFGYQAIYLPGVNNWGEKADPGAAGSETSLIWPGKPYGLTGPIPSIRLKRLRRGIEDYEYLWLLERNRRPRIASLIAGDLFRYGGTDCYGEHFLDARGQGWVSDPLAWSLAHRLMARELTTAIQDETGEEDTGKTDDVARFEQQIEWARLTKAVRQMRAIVEGVRIRFDDQDDQRPVAIEAIVSLFNATSEPFTGTLNWVNLPEGWLIDEGVAIEDLLPSRRLRRTLKARTATVQTNSEGILPVEVAVLGNETDSRPFSGRLCALTAPRASRAIVIDGDLSDWALAPTVASDFVLVGALDVPEGDRGRLIRASQLTTVFVCHDRDYLNIAFNCKDDALAARRITRSNYVEYDELWPVGEDLVEVVLDPGSRAVDAGDLFHILVKANGAVITERGSKPLQDVASYAHWAVDVAAAIDDTSQPDRWTVEIRIPLASLGQRSDVWGVNFGRFDRRRGEYASWSPARSHLCTPTSLGNMRLAP